MHKLARTTYNKAKHFFSGDFNQLLVLLFLLFVFRPHGLQVSYITIWHLFFTGVLLAAIFNCHHKPRVKTAALVLGVPTLIINWSSLFIPNPTLFLYAMIASLIFLIFSIFSLLNRVLLGRVTPDILRGTICVYFMIGFAFALIYSLLELFHPGSFKGIPIEPPPFFTHGHYHAEMVYFSFVTLIAIGYGDIIVSTNLTQIAAICEALIGQFYLAILVARIVSAYARRAQRAEVPKKSK